jgi:hypothetical protein
LLAYDHLGRRGLGNQRREVDNDGEEENKGYFGFQILPKEVAVWGDYSGVSFFPSLGTFVAEDHDQEQAAWTHPISVAGCNQVTAVCQEESFLFLGFDSGTMQCRSLNAKVEDNSQEYPCISVNSNTHSNEVACLAKAGNTHLASGGSKEGNIAVYVHWNALRDGKLDRVSRCPIIARGGGPVRCVASTMACDGHSMYVTHAAGDGTVCISIWNEVAPLENYTFRHPFNLVRWIIPWGLLLAASGSM